MSCVPPEVFRTINQTDSGQNRRAKRSAGSRQVTDAGYQASVQILPQTVWWSVLREDSLIHREWTEWKSLHGDKRFLPDLRYHKDRQKWGTRISRTVRLRGWTTNVRVSAQSLIMN